MSGAIKGYPSQKKSHEVKPDYVTVQNVGSEQYALDVRAKSTAYSVGTDAAEANSTTTQVIATAHAAQIGDLIRWTSGALDGFEWLVASPGFDANTIPTAQEFPSIPAPGDTFEIYRYRTQLVGSDGSISTLTRFILDGVTTTVNEDTVTPANNAPLPVKLTSATGDINITAGDLNVQLSHTGASFDSTRIGDGTELLAIETDNAAKVGVFSSTGNRLAPNADGSVPVTDNGGSLTTDTGQLPATLGQKAKAASLAVTLASDEDTLNVAVSNFPAVQPVNDNGGSLTVDDGGTSLSIDDAGGSITTDTDQLPSALGSQLVAGSVSIVLASNHPAISAQTAGKQVIETVRNDYTGTPVTTGAWVELIASTSAEINAMSIFDSSGQTLEIGTGAPAGETRLFIVYPGGVEAPVNIPASTRVSIRAISANATVGEIDINAYS